MLLLNTYLVPNICFNYIFQNILVLPIFETSEPNRCILDKYASKHVFITKEWLEREREIYSQCKKAS